MYKRQYNTFVTFLTVLSCIFSRAHAQVKPMNQFSRFMAKTTCFRTRRALLGLDDRRRHLGELCPKIPLKLALFSQNGKIQKSQYLRNCKSDQAEIWGQSSDHQLHLVDGQWLPYSKFNMTDGCHFGNRNDVITQPVMVRFGRNLVHQWRIAFPWCEDIRMEIGCRISICRPFVFRKLN